MHVDTNLLHSHDFVHAIAIATLPKSSSLSLLILVSVFLQNSCKQNVFIAGRATNQAITQKDTTRSYSFWNPYTPCGKFTASFPQGECDFQMDCQLTPPMCNILFKYTTEGVEISYWSVKWASPFEIVTPLVKNLSLIFHRGSVEFKCISPIECLFLKMEIAWIYFTCQLVRFYYVRDKDLFPRYLSLVNAGTTNLSCVWLQNILCK